MQTQPFLRPLSVYVAARDDYLLIIEQENRVPATIAKYRYAIERLHRFACDAAPATIDATLLRRWLVQLRQEGLAESTQAYYLGSIKTWLRWLEGEGGYGVKAERTARVRPPRIIEEPLVPFSETEIARLFAAFPSRNERGQRGRAIIAILLDTGIRMGEIVVLPMTDKMCKGRTIGLGWRAKLELSRY